MTKNIFRRILSIASALAIVFTAYPPVIFADDGGLCPHHPEHTAECGYVEGASPCNFVCEICDPPEASDSTEPSNTPAPEVTTSPEEQPPVTTAPEPEPVETGTTEVTPEESETMPTEPIPEPEVQLMAVNEEHVAHDGISQPWTIENSLPDSGNYYLTTDVTLTSTWTVTDSVNLCLNGHKIECALDGIVVESGSLAIYDCDSSGSGKIVNETGSYAVSVPGGFFTLYNGIIEAAHTAISSEEGIVSIYGGEVIGGETGIYAKDPALTIYGGKITGKTEYGIYFDSSISATLLYAPIIEGGKASIYLTTNSKIMVNQYLSADVANIISLEMQTPGVFQR